MKGPRGHVLFSKGATCGRPTPSMQFLAFTGFHKASVIIHVSNLTSSGGERISRSLMKGICLGLCARSGSSSMVPQYSLKMRVSFAQSCLTLCDLPMRFSREEYWSGLPCPPPGDFPDPGIEPRSPALQVDSLLFEPPGGSLAKSQHLELCTAVGEMLMQGTDMGTEMEGTAES